MNAGAVGLSVRPGTKAGAEKWGFHSAAAALRLLVPVPVPLLPAVPEAAAGAVSTVSGLLSRLVSSL